MKPKHILLFLTVPVLLASFLSRLSPFTSKVKSLKARTLSVDLRAQEDIQPSAFGSFYLGGFHSGVLYEITWNRQLQAIDSLKPLLTLKSILGIAVVEVFDATPENTDNDILGERLLLCDPKQGLVEAIVYRKHVQGEYRFLNATHRLILNEAMGRPLILCDAVRSKADISGNIHVILTDASKMDIRYIHQELFTYPSGRLLYVNFSRLQEVESQSAETDILAVANSIARLVRANAAYPNGIEIVDVINERVKFICVEAFGPYITEYNYEIPTGETLARGLIKNGIVGNNVTPMRLRLPYNSELVKGRRIHMYNRSGVDAMYLIAVPHVYSGFMKFISWIVTPFRIVLSPFLPLPLEFEMTNIPFSPPGGLAILNRTSGELTGIFVSGENDEDLRGTSTALLVDASGAEHNISVLLGSALASNPVRLATIDLEESIVRIPSLSR